jgi:transcription elongation factor Elf1
MYTKRQENKKMTDLFDNTVLCKNCQTKMRNVNLVKTGFLIRALQCPKCGNKIYHPADIEEYRKFSELKNKAFKVKLRVVGNSYAVSIPKEIVDFIHEQEKIMNDIVNLCFEEAGKLSLVFNKKALLEPSWKEASGRNRRELRGNQKISYRENQRIFHAPKSTAFCGAPKIKQDSLRRESPDFRGGEKKKNLR